eukprot:1093939-Pelagomonas_calceolata.AAC.3
MSRSLEQLLAFEQEYGAQVSMCAYVPSTKAAAAFNTHKEQLLTLEQECGVQLLAFHVYRCPYLTASLIHHHHSHHHHHYCQPNHIPPIIAHCKTHLCCIPCLAVSLASSLT